MTSRSNSPSPRHGLCVVFLGPDGAGKSTLLEAVEQKLALQAVEYKSFYFAPGLLKRYRSKGDEGITTNPHDAPINGQIKNFLRLLILLFEFRIGMPRLLRKHSLVLFDRHMIDMLVDAKRYRMVPVRWWMRLLFRAIPQPEKLVVISAPAQTIQDRKQEVPFHETEKQLHGYAEMADGHRNALRVENVGPPIETASTIVDFIMRR